MKVMCGTFRFGRGVVFKEKFGTFTFYCFQGFFDDKTFFSICLMVWFKAVVEIHISEVFLSNPISWLSPTMRRSIVQLPLLV